MKKLIVTAFAFFAFASTSFAQEKKVEFGVKAGANIAFVTTDDPNPYAKPIYTPNLGAFVNYNFSEKFSLQLDLMYSRQGIQVDEQPLTTVDDIVELKPLLAGLPEAITDENLKGTISRYYTYNYINLPLVAKYEVVSGLNVMAGAQIGFLLGANKNSSYDVPQSSIDLVNGNIEALNTFAASINGAIDGGVGDIQMGLLPGGDQLPAEYQNFTANQLKAAGADVEATAGSTLLASKRDELLEEGDFDNTDSFNSIDVSLVFGAQYELPSGIFFDARFNLGMTDIKTDEAKIADGQDVDAAYVKNRTVQLGIGYKF